MVDSPRTVLVAAGDARLRRRLQDQLSRRRDVVFLAEAADGTRTIEAIRQGNPDLVLLEAQLPGGSGFGVVEQIGADAMPIVIFLTSLESRTLRALEVHALDYLLEPFDDERFHAAIDHAMRYTERFASDGLRRRLERLLAADEEGSRARRIPIRSAGKVQFVPLDEVRWVEAAGSYARLHLYDGRTHLLRESLDALSKRFTDDFLRIHRSTLVRSSEVAEIQRQEEGYARVVLRDGSELRVSRQYREGLEPMSRAHPGRQGAD